MSKITVAGVRTNVQGLLEYSLETKKRNFLETVELQIGLKNYDPQRDKRFSGSVRLPVIPRPNMSVCILGDQHDIDRAKHGGVDAMSSDDLKKLNKNKKLIKKLARKYDAFVASDTLIKQIPRLLGPGLSKAGKFPTPVSHNEDLSGKINEVKSTIKFQLRKVLCMGVAVGNVGMTEDQLISNIMLAINYLSCNTRTSSSSNVLSADSGFDSMQSAIGSVESPYNSSEVLYLQGSGEWAGHSRNPRAPFGLLVKTSDDKAPILIVIWMSIISTQPAFGPNSSAAPKMVTHGDISLSPHHGDTEEITLDQIEAPQGPRSQQETRVRPLNTTMKEPSWSNADPSNTEESTKAQIERLGRQRPEVFGSIWAEIGCVLSISASQLITVRFTVILPTLVKDLNIPEASVIWPASAFSLTVASFLLIFGRIADIYGGFPVYVGGIIWLTLWSLIAGFSTNDIMLNFCRALQGFGPAAFLPSGVMILGSIYRPGPRKNLVFSLYGSCAPLGFYSGILFAGITADFTSWSWYFWIGAILAAIIAVTSYLSIPSDTHEKRNASTKIKMDWLGVITIVPGLVLFTFAIIDSSHAPNQWKTPYIYTLFLVGSLFLLIAAYIETFVATQPLLPFSLFQVPCMKAFIAALFLTYGSLGIFLLYATFYMESIMGGTPLQVVAWYTPMALGGCFISTFGGLFLHLLTGTTLVIISGISWIIAPLLFAIAPEGANYWAYIFPSMICATIGADIGFNVANIFITTSLPRKQQGLAGAVTMLILHLGIAVFLGFGDIVNTYTVERLGERRSYHAVFWFELACAAMALAILVLFVKIRKAESEMTVEEREELERAVGVDTDEGEVNVENKEEK
ncbi:hypothetical protein B7494_g3384 [Chlorociboria aeruginascens]|nr:hypothetical protein B7494_g3384 [Chlorociboria aeruginascens]